MVAQILKSVVDNVASRSGEAKISHFPCRQIDPKFIKLVLDIANADSIFLVEKFEGEQKGQKLSRRKTSKIRDAPAVPVIVLNG